MKYQDKGLSNPFGVRVVKEGLSESRFQDLNHRVLAATWPQFFFWVSGIYLAMNAFFAALYYMGDGSILNADPNSYWDAFVFSFQTSTTIGYGHLQPATKYANVIVLFDTIVGITFVAITTGLTFAKFSRPTAKVMFSQKCLINTIYGKRTLMFRMANTRDSHIAGATTEVVAVIEQISEEGDVMQRIYDLNLVRPKSPIFFMSWTAMHIIDENSPLYGMSLEDMEKQKLRIVISLNGTDDWSAQSVHTNHVYRIDDLVFDKKFVDIITRANQEEFVMDYANFDSLRD